MENGPRYGVAVILAIASPDRPMSLEKKSRYSALVRNRANKPGPWTRERPLSRPPGCRHSSGRLWSEQQREISSGQQSVSRGGQDSFQIQVAGPSTVASRQQPLLSLQRTSLTSLTSPCRSPEAVPRTCLLCSVPRQSFRCQPLSCQCSHQCMSWKLRLGGPRPASHFSIHAQSASA